MGRVWTAFKFDFENSLRGDIFLGLVLGTLFLLAARANTTNVALAVLGETAKTFFRAVTEVDSIVMLLALFCGALLVATHEKRTRREKGHFRKYLFRAFLRFSADAVAVAFGATIIQVLFAHFLADICHALRIGAQYAEPDGEWFLVGRMLYLAACTIYFWTCREICEGVVDRYLLKTFKTRPTEFSKTVLRVG